MILSEKDNTITLHSTFKDNPFCPKESRIQILSYQPLAQCEVVLNAQISENTLWNYDLTTNILDFTNRQIKEIERCLYNERTESASLYHWLVFGKGEKSEKPNRIFNGWKEMTVKSFYDLPYPGLLLQILDFLLPNLEFKFDGIKHFLCQRTIQTNE